MAKVKTSAIETVSGKFLDLADPQEADILASDIAWGLSREARFGGHTITAIPYSVAQHSISVADIVSSIFDEDENRYRQDALDYFGEGKTRDIILKREQYSGKIELYALLHDASEAYLRDIPSPAKNLPGLKEAYAKIEKQLMSAIHKRFCLEPILENKRPIDLDIIGLVHWADMYALTVEAYHMLPSRGLNWSTTMIVNPINLMKFDEPKPALRVYQEFLTRIDYLI